MLGMAIRDGGSDVGGLAFGLVAGMLLLGAGVVLAFDLRGVGRRWISSVDNFYGVDRGASAATFVRLLGGGILILGLVVSVGFSVALFGRM